MITAYVDNILNELPHSDSHVIGKQQESMSLSKLYPHCWTIKPFCQTAFKSDNENKMMNSIVTFLNVIILHSLQRSFHVNILVLEYFTLKYLQDKGQWG